MFPKTFIALFLLTILASTCFAQLIYNPGDSIVYYNLSGNNLYANRNVLLRFHDGGSRISWSNGFVPYGNISTMDGIAGHLYVNHEWLDSAFYIHTMQFRSIDSGETWTALPLMPTWSPIGMGRCGVLPGQSMMANNEYPEWIYCTSNSWQTYDSTRIHRQIVAPTDSVWFLQLSPQIGTLYGMTWNGQISDTTQRLCISSDTGHSWILGGVLPQNIYSSILGCGITNELWVSCFGVLQLLRDTGRVFIDSVFVLHLPERPYGPHIYHAPTNNPGEIYIVADFDYWTVPCVNELFVYHIRNYGAVVDSFYYVLYNYQTSVSEHSPRLPGSYRLSACPNPFNSSTRIKWQTPFVQPTRLVVSDVLGRRVWEWQGKGSSVLWNGNTDFGGAISSGKYFITVQIGRSGQQTIPVTLLR